MVIIDSYALALAMCFITMICWGSWANTQKMAGSKWPFPLFYWDYALGVFLFSLIIAFTMGSTGSAGRSFLADLGQASLKSIALALVGGVIFNLANILFVAAIDLSGLAVAFPVAIGLSLTIGVIINYAAAPVGNPVLLFLGVSGILTAVVIDAAAYKSLPSGGQRTTTKGLVVSVAGGVLMGFFYRFVAASMATDFRAPEAGSLTPYTAVFIFSAGLLVSNLLWNSLVMAHPFKGERVSYRDYFKKGTLRLHSIGALGGMIWNLGMSFSIIAAGVAGFAISYSLGQAATMVAAFWGVFVWKEFQGAPKKSNRLIAWMFVIYLVSLSLIVVARVI